ncbi:uncharacterized protein LOC127752348 [Frankliniella occidentalis]|uniref:Uncharacterized protein LOC127752348 n=1 Tax=Frankliniella occidentalis TaxID=133901 RepID=A0A9C6XWI7_FRAOC|nr:uncharacterized protein LOC127752348 [Frankliniella occidentalis]
MLTVLGCAPLFTPHDNRIHGAARLLCSLSRTVGAVISIQAGESNAAEGNLTLDVVHECQNADGVTAAEIEEVSIQNKGSSGKYVRFSYSFGKLREASACRTQGRPTRSTRMHGRQDAAYQLGA